MAEYVSYPRQSGKNTLRKALNALESIQELHRLEYEVRPLYPTSNYNAEPAGTAEHRICANCKTYYPCDTRRLADEALGGEERG